MKYIYRLLILSSIFVVDCYSAVAADWPQWRGPDGTGVALGTAPPPGAWTNLQKRWQMQIGAGYGSPVVADGRLFIVAGNTLFCLDATNGQTLWKGQNKRDSSPSHSTPCIAGRFACAMLNGAPHCFEADTGKLLWNGPYFGKDVSTSPRVADKVAVFSGPEALRGYDLETGKQLWSQPQAAAENTQNASPAVWSHLGTNYIIVNASGKQVCVEAKTGNVLWKTDRGGSFQTPVISGDIEVVGSNHQGDWLTFWKLSPTGATRLAEHKLGNCDATVVISQEQVYAFSNDALLCLNLKDGAIAWKTPVKVAYSSAIMIDHHLVFLTKGAKSLAVIKVDRQTCTPVAEIDLQASDCVTPLVVDSRLYLRLKNNTLACFDLLKVAKID